MMKLCKSLQPSMTTTDKSWSEKLVWVLGSGGLKLMHSKASINLQEKGLGGVWWNNDNVTAIFQTKHTMPTWAVFYAEYIPSSPGDYFEPELAAGTPPPPRGVSSAPRHSLSSTSGRKTGSCGECGHGFLLDNGLDAANSSSRL